MTVMETDTSPSTSSHSGTGNGRSVLANGGVILVVGGRTSNFPNEYREHPRLVFWDSTENHRIDQVPANTKAIVFTKFVDHSLSGGLYNYARQKGIIFTPPDKGTHRVKDTLDQLLGENPVEAHKKVIAAKGSIKALIEKHCDFSKGTAEEARRLLAIAQSEGIPTTIGSLNQGIQGIRRARGLTATPASAQPRLSQAQTALNTLDDTIAGLQILRDFVRDTEIENTQLKNQLLNIKNDFAKYFAPPTPHQQSQQKEVH
jgi:hypothetical protein